MLAVVRAPFEIDWAIPEWIEDELVRRGARDARLVEDGIVAVTVEASSPAHADELVRDLLHRIGARVLEHASHTHSHSRIATPAGS
jgi:hypothetical protein